MHTQHEGKVVLVAGGTGGLGSAVSLLFLQGEARVVVTYRKEDEFTALKSAAGPKGSSLSGYDSDVTDSIATAKLVDTIVQKDGRLDALVNTVGGYIGGKNLWDLEVKEFERMISLNLMAGFALTHAAVPVMLKQGHGSIVNVAAKAAFDHGAGASAYAASKAAAVALMDSLAADTRGKGVRVNTILPSIIDTAVNRHAMPNAPFEEWPKPDEIAHVIAFLCSEESEVIHGASIPVYGNY